jgi:hypothetical protein
LLYKEDNDSNSISGKDEKKVGEVGDKKGSDPPSDFNKEFNFEKE